MLTGRASPRRTGNPFPSPAPLIDDPAQPEDPSTPFLRGHVVASNLSFHHRGRAILDRVDLDAPPGSTTLIVGPSPTDTDTALGLLLGLYAPSAGSITLDGAPLDGRPRPEPDPARGPGPVALVLQEPWIMAGSLADNITCGDPTVSRSRIETVAALACLDELTGSLPDGLDTPVVEGGVGLTVGQRRRLALARALLNQPAVLLIEHPLEGLSARDATPSIRAINRARRKRTTIMTASSTTGADQRLSDPAVRLAALPLDSVLWLDRGRLEPGGDRRPRSTARVTRSPVGAEAPEPVTVGATIGGDARALGLRERRARTEIWSAWSPERDDLIDVRVVRPGRGDHLDLAQEYDRACRLRHPGLVRPIGADLSARSPYTLYHRVDGHRLDHVLAGRLPRPRPFDAVRIGADLTRAVAFLHRAGYAHLGLRPAVVVTTGRDATITDLTTLRPFGADCSDIDRTGEPASAARDLLDLGRILAALRLPAELGPLIDELTSPDPAARPEAQAVFDGLRPPLLPASPRPGGSGDHRWRDLGFEIVDRPGAATGPPP